MSTLKVTCLSVLLCVITAAVVAADKGNLGMTKLDQRKEVIRRDLPEDAEILGWESDAKDFKATSTNDSSIAEIREAITSNCTGKTVGKFCSSANKNYAANRVVLARDNSRGYLFIKSADKNWLIDQAVQDHVTDLKTKKQQILGAVYSRMGNAVAFHVSGNQLKVFVRASGASWQELKHNVSDQEVSGAGESDKGKSDNDVRNKEVNKVFAVHATPGGRAFVVVKDGYSELALYMYEQAQEKLLRVEGFPVPGVADIGAALFSEDGTILDVINCCADDIGHRYQLDRLYGR